MTWCTVAAADRCKHNLHHSGCLCCNVTLAQGAVMLENVVYRQRRFWFNSDALQAFLQGGQRKNNLIGLNSLVKGLGGSLLAFGEELPALIGVEMLLVLNEGWKRDMLRPVYTMRSIHGASH